MGYHATPPQIPWPWLVGVGNHGGKCVPGSHGAERQRGAGGRLVQVGPSPNDGTVKRDVFSWESSSCTLSFLLIHQC